MFFALNLPPGSDIMVPSYTFFASIVPMRLFGLVLTLSLIPSLILAPLAADAQQAGTRLPRIGYLSGGSESARDVAFRQELRERGYIEGQNIAIEYRFAEGKLPSMTST